jgi:tryptophan halogenase
MKPLKKIAIVGGGSSGWIAAAMLAYHLKRDLCQIELVESDDLGTIGIGESTIPPFVGLIKSLGIDEQDFIQKTGASFKLGIKFADWQQKNSGYFHPFGVIGKRIGSHDFYQCWLKASMSGNSSPLQDYSPSTVMAENGRFYLPSKAQNTPIGGANYALHVDAKAVARYFRDYAEARGVVRSEGMVTHSMRRENGHIDKLVLHDGREIAADFFIDCTGFHSLLLGKTLDVGFEDWSQYLPCDRAIAVKTTHQGVTTPYTQATARDAGWSWRIPLQERTGHGYVYASQFCSDDKAKRTLLKNIDGKLVNEARVIPFVTGRRRELWKHNCLALGLAAGFVEPLESTAIHLIARGMDFFLRFFPDQDCDATLMREYNRRMTADYEEVRDFIVLHYCTTQRDDTPFWRWCKTMDIPDSLRERIELFKGHGLLREGVDELFRNASWQSVFEGMGIRPQKYCPRVDNIDFGQIDTTLQKARQAILTMVKTLPTHDEFLRSSALAK